MATASAREATRDLEPTDPVHRFLQNFHHAGDDERNLSVLMGLPTVRYANFFDAQTVVVLPCARHPKEWR